MNFTESLLTAPCRTWLAQFLRRQYPRSTCSVLVDTERRGLRRALDEAGLIAYFPEASAWEVQVDVVGVVQRKRTVELTFVELKRSAIKLVDVGQLLGYCRVCRPAQAFLLSPRGPSGSLHRLLTAYGRTDLLLFEGHSIQVGAWDSQSGAPNWQTLIPGGLLPSV